MDLQHVLSTAPPRPDEVLPGLLAGTVGMLAGAGGLGKTMLEIQIAVALAAGLADRDGVLSEWAPGELGIAPQRVVLVAAEESHDIVWRRLHAVLAVLNQLNIVPRGTCMRDVVQLLHRNLIVFAIAGQARLQLIDDRLRRTGHMHELMAVSEGARLIVLDPLRQLHTLDENSSAAMSALISEFKMLAQCSGGAVVFAHHTSRAADWQGQADSAGAARGSTALSNDVRWQLNLAPLGSKQAERMRIKPAEARAHVMLHDAKRSYGAQVEPLLLRRVAGGVLQSVRKLEQGCDAPESAGNTGRSRRCSHAEAR